MKEFLTPDILQTIIICCTIIIIGLIAVSAYRIKKEQQKTWDSYIFTASVLLILAITIFSYCFCRDRNVLDFISLASALISIILAIVTIIYSYFTNSRSSGQIDKLNKAAEDVSKATSSYATSAESLQENIQKIINAVNRVEEKTDQLLEYKSSNKKNSYNLNNNSFDLPQYAESYINSSSPLGIIAIYACIKAKETNKEWCLNFFNSEYNQAYCAAYIISTSSTGLITSTIDFNTGIVRCYNFLEPIKACIDNWMQQNSILNVESFKDLKDNIDNYFNNSK